MKIAYYMPFKPLGHANPSGDLVIGTELYNFLAEKGHTINLASRLRCRWIYYRPLTLLQLLRARNKIIRQHTATKPELWLSYHSYYKAPDLLGSSCAKRLNIPYVIFQGIYSTKRRKQLKNLPGFLLNRRVLQAADHIFTNKKRDITNLRRLLPEDRLSYIAPGIQPELFEFSTEWRNKIRKQWSITNEAVIMSAAMMRPGVKTEGIIAVIQSCGELLRRGLPLQLVIAGDGSSRHQLEKMAAEFLPGHHIFLGKVSRKELYRYYSGADIFVFPGIEESLGMVYLEAQSCGLPIVAYSDWGAGEAVIHECTGLLSPAAEPSSFTDNIEQLIVQPDRRQLLGNAAGKHIRSNHNLLHNYNQLEKKLLQLTGRKQRS